MFSCTDGFSGNTCEKGEQLCPVRMDSLRLRAKKEATFSCTDFQGIFTKMLTELCINTSRCNQFGPCIVTYVFICHGRLRT